ncbi:peptidase A4 family-domain-containing protein [Mycena galopus ATCC 62051]|nr:peptidase A4 family-domain-containing protein [Mycena galopus ATCC 62051]
MMFASTFFSYVLFAATALAAASPRSNLNARIARRRAGAHQSGTRLPAFSDGINSAIAGNASKFNVDYSSNWAGAAWESPEGTYTSVTGTFVVPTPQAPSGGGSGMYSASAWVGIDGDTCGSAILQTGIDFTIDNGAVSFDSWYEYFPDAAHDFEDFAISAGDTITLTATASSDTAGTVTIENISTGKTVTQALTSTAQLCGENAEWIVEDYEEGGSLVPFANFGTVTFMGARATTSDGSTVGPDGAALIDIQQGSTVLTSVSATSDSVTVSYV